MTHRDGGTSFYPLPKVMMSLLYPRLRLAEIVTDAAAVVPFLSVTASMTVYLPAAEKVWDGF